MFLSAEKIAAMAGEHERISSIRRPANKQVFGDAAGLKSRHPHDDRCPGDRSSEYHSHRYEDEAIYVISGGTAVIGEDSFKIGPGISVFRRGPPHETT
jgi:uncharacterized cupin superfamily protein